MISHLAFQLIISWKDLTIALEEAEAMKLSLPGLALVKQLYIAIRKAMVKFFRKPGIIPRFKGFPMEMII